MTVTHTILRNAHIAAGLLTLVAGAAAMTFRKGSPLHRRAGNAFFVAMLVLSMAGVTLAIVGGPNLGTAMGGMTAFYMVVTAWATVIRPPGRTGRFEIGAALLGLTVSVAATSFAILALNDPKGLFFGYPALMYFIFAGVLLLATALDARMIARGGLTGTARTTRHLWRMSLSFFMATGSFFFGQPRFVPSVLRETGLYIVAGLLPLGLMLFWLIRVRIWPSLRKRLSLRVA
ncbi:MAG: hypothetical protein ACRENU_14140 [Gemmatimonadaceae bacterium]